VVARRPAETPNVNVLLVETGGTDDLANVMETYQWPTNLGSERDWPSKPSPTNISMEVVLSLGAIHTPKVLMQSGIGDETELKRFGHPMSRAVWSDQSVNSRLEQCSRSFAVLSPPGRLILTIDSGLRDGHNI
jgi:choline dehydrogenase